MKASGDVMKTVTRQQFMTQPSSTRRLPGSEPERRGSFVTAV
jgi:hypothetical protein